MTRISDPARVAALLQWQRSARQLPQASSTSQTLSPQSPSAATRTAVPGISAPPGNVGAVIAALEGEGDALFRAAFRVYLRHRLAQDLGNAFEDSGQADHVVDQILREMEEDEELRRGMMEAGEHLIQRSRQTSA